MNTPVRCLACRHPDHMHNASGCHRANNTDLLNREDEAQDAIRWATAMRQAAEERAADRSAAAAHYAAFTIEWTTWKTADGDTVERPASWKASIEQFLRSGLSMSELTDFVAIAMESRSTDKWKYFCGCCWRRITELQERATEIVRDETRLEPASALLTTRWTIDELAQHHTDSRQFAASWLAQESVDPGRRADHPSGRAVDLMIPNLAYGDQIYAALQENWALFHIRYILYKVPSHWNHIHVTVD